MKRPIVVINPNSNQSVTDGLGECLARFNNNKSHPIECVTLKNGPFGIESQLHVHPVEITQKELLLEVSRLNADPKIHGILGAF